MEWARSKSLKVIRDSLIDLIASPRLIALKRRHSEKGAPVEKLGKTFGANIDFHDSSIPRNTKRSPKEITLDLSSAESGLFRGKPRSFARTANYSTSPAAPLGGEGVGPRMGKTGDAEVS